MQMNSRPSPIWAIALLGLGLAGCGGNPFAAPPINAAPTQPVATQTLAPPPAVEAQPAQVAEDASAAATAPAQQVAAFGPANVDQMSGGWTINDASGACSLFMSTTTWTGGYRAVTRGCPSAGLQSVNAWDVVDGKIALKDGAGTEIARLTKTGETQFQGAFSSGGSVSFSR